MNSSMTIMAKKESLTFKDEEPIEERKQRSSYQEVEKVIDSQRKVLEMEMRSESSMSSREQ